MTVKGRFGLSLAAIAAIGFGFGALRQPLAVLLICGFALLAEQNEWLNRQATQALLLTIGFNVITLVAGWAFRALATLPELVKLYSVRDAVYALGSFVDGLIYVVFIALSLLAILRVLRGKEALPWLARLAGGGLEAPLGKAAPLPRAQPQSAGPVYAAPVQPMPEPASAPPAQHAPEPAPVLPPQPVPEPAPAPLPQPEANVRPARQCPSCLAPLQEGNRFCTACGARVE